MTDLLSDLDILVDCGFRIQNQKLMLTYKTHIDKDAFDIFILGLVGVPKRCYIAHENGENDELTPYEHSHVVIDFGRVFQSRNCRVFDFRGIHPNISKIKAKANWKRACKYITKEDKSVTLHPDDIFDNTNAEDVINKIWECENMADALTSMTSLRDTLNTIAIFERKPIDKPNPRIHEAQFYPWQKELVEKLEFRPDGRTVNWICDPIGGSGKSRFAEWMCLTCPEKAVMLNNIGKISDFAQNMHTFWNQGFRGNTVFLNLSRSYADRTNIYEAMEIIVDGYITCTKYTGGVVWLPEMHVVVLANFMPAYEALSLDRWKVFKIENLELTPVTLNGGEKPRFKPYRDPVIIDADA